MERRRPDPPTGARSEVAALLAKAEAADQADLSDGMSIPEELERREDRLKALAAAKATIEARARERCEREQADYEAKLAARAAKTEASGRKPGGKPPAAPVEGPLPTDQVNLTGIVNLTSHGRAWAEGGDAGRHHAAVRAHVSSRQTLNAVAREVR